MQTRGSSMLTEIKICYKNNGQYKQLPIPLVVGNCPVHTFTIKGSVLSFFRILFIFPIILLLKSILFYMQLPKDWSTIFAVYDY